jgi:oxepin-CoA hydrolase/3-oxo-5,6-dehydrosuberyl-CoA semialdehyde dehydrogenase
MIEANILPRGRDQLIVGGVGDLFDHFTGQDVVSFTGSASTALKLRTHPTVMRESVRSSPSRTASTPRCSDPSGAGHAEFDLFIKEVATEMTVKAGRNAPRSAGRWRRPNISTRCSRRLPSGLAKTKVGDPRAEDTRMGAWSASASATTCAPEDRRARSRGRANRRRRSRCRVPGRGRRIPAASAAAHDDPVGDASGPRLRAVRPVSTIMPYRDMADAIALANRGKGSLALSLFTHSPDARASSSRARAAYHGRMLVLEPRQCRGIDRPRLAAAVLVHGGPGRAGGSEEMGGVRGVKHYMQRTALQSSPAMIAAITEQYVPARPSTSSTSTRSG